MKPAVNKKKCTGCGTCVALCPQVFAIGPDGKSKVINIKGCDQGECNCQSAVDSCPAQAISLKK